jgi:NAD(P)H-hydrate epimerase
MSLFPIATNVPAVTTAQMRAVDRMMIQEYGITLVRMMENAGRNLADLARAKFGHLQDKTILVLAGGGNNGGGGMVAARHLYNWGANVRVVVSTKQENGGVAGEQLAILQKMNVPLATKFAPEQIVNADFIIDALIGYGLKGAPRGEIAEWIHLANEARAPILALDAPSGLDTSDGTVFDPCIRAHATMTLALPKTGLYASHARAVIGELYLADISVPRGLYETLNLQVPHLFAAASIVRVG